MIISGYMYFSLAVYFIHMYIYIYTYTYIHLYIYTYTYIYIYTSYIMYYLISGSTFVTLVYCSISILCYPWLPFGKLIKLLNMAHLLGIFPPQKKVIFHSFVSLPECNCTAAAFGQISKMSYVMYNVNTRKIRVSLSL